jgi:hypothetical protein
MTQVTLDSYYAGVTAAIKAAFPQFRTVEFDREDREALPLPACLLSISEFEDAAEADAGTGQWSTLAHVQAHVILGFRETRVHLAVRKAATSLAVWLRLKRFPDLDKPGKTLPTGPALVTGCYEDDFHPELDKYEVWRVEFLQALDLGLDVWAADNEGVTPVPVFGHVPDVGVGAEECYRDLEGNPQPARGNTVLVSGKRPLSDTDKKILTEG